MKHPDRKTRSDRRPAGFRLALSWLVLSACIAAQAPRADVGVLIGGGWSGPRGDSASYVLNGVTGGVGVEAEVTPNLGILLEGSYLKYGAKTSRLKAGLNLPSDDPLDAETSVIGLTLAPKLYLTNREVAAYVLFGGGPNWVVFERTAAVTGAKSSRREHAWSTTAGFGVDVMFSESFRLGFSPTYHRVNTERRPIQYAAFVFYLKL